MNKGQVAQGVMIGAVLISSIIGSASTWIIEHVLSSPETQAASISQVSSRVSTLETKQSATDTTTKNQGNKIDYLVTAVQKIGTKLNVDVGPPPLNQ